MAYYGSKLRSARVVVLPLHGTRNTQLPIEIEHLRSLQTFHILYDDTRREGSRESKAIADVRRHWPELDLPPTKTQFDCPDILWALPEELWKRALGSHYDTIWPGKDAIEALYASETREKGLNTFALDHVGL